MKGKEEWNGQLVHVIYRIIEWRRIDGTNGPTPVNLVFQLSKIVDKDYS